MPISCLHGERRHVRGKEYLAAMSYRRGMRDSIAHTLKPDAPQSLSCQRRKKSVYSLIHTARDCLGIDFLPFLWE